MINTDLEKDLNPEQLTAVMAGEGPILVLAGAGSGKTRTLTYRAIKLLNDGIKPDNILLATFTNKAAKEMLYRIAQLNNTNTERLWGGTFHHLANRVLRRHSSLLGYKSGYTILDSDDSNKLIKSCITETGIDNKTEDFPRENIIANIKSYSTNTVQNIETTILKKYPYSFTKYTKEIENILELYAHKKIESNCMDFNDLLVNWYKLLSSTQLKLEQYNNQFRYILIDEYQDTSKLQANIVDLLASFNRNLMVVGDDFQSIYSFNGANYDNILEFPKRYPDAKIIKLETNYRSTPEILDIANKSIANNEKQFQKTLRAVRETGSSPVIFAADNTSRQASFVVDQVKYLLQEGLKASEIAVLYRAHYHSMELQMELTHRNVPFIIHSGIRFFEQAHIKDLIAYLRVIANPRDESAWKRILQLYSRIGPRSASRIWKYVSLQENPTDAVFKQEFVNCGGKKECIKSLTKLSDTLQQLIISNSQQLSVPELIDQALDNYREILQAKYTEASSREEEIEQLKEYSAKFESLGGFLNELALFSSMADTGENISRDYQREERIVLSTIHQAKGLEWQAVFLIGCADGMIPLGRALKEEGGEEEERRMFYVACTRAKDKLCLCYPKIKHTRSKIINLNPSRFIEELRGHSTRWSIFVFIICMLLMLVGGPTHAKDNGWVKIYRNTEEIRYVKKGNNIPVGIYNTGTPSYWSKYTFLKTRKSPENPEKQIKQVICQTVYNCGKKTTALKQEITYFTDGDSKTLTNPYISEMSFEEVIPDSVGETELNYICSGKLPILPR